MPFRRVEARLAGPAALGILVPPGLRTVVIVRPRSLTWDLLPASWNGDARSAPLFSTFTRNEAAAVARQLFDHLDAAARNDVNPVETLGDAGGRRFQVWLRTGSLVWIVCPRAVGQAYQPLVFGSYDEALAAAELLTPLVWPRGDGEQQCYFNTQQFG